jgi:hypothetical protein
MMPPDPSILAYRLNQAAVAALRYQRLGMRPPRARTTVVQLQAFDSLVVDLLRQTDTLRVALHEAVHPVALAKFSPEAKAFTVRKLGMLVADIANVSKVFSE